MGILSSILGTKAPQAPEILTADPRYMQGLEGDVSRVRKYSQTPVTSLTKAGQLSQAELERQRGLASDYYGSQVQRDINTGIQSAMLQGGISSGTAGRALQQGQRSADAGRTAISQKYQDLAAQAAIGDYGMQDQRRYETMLSTPQLQSGLMNAEQMRTAELNKARMARYQHDALENERKRSKYTGLLTMGGGIAGGIVGTMAGGPMGGMMGAQAGSALGGQTGNILV